MTPEAIVRAARSYIGVPFRHRGRSRAGVDCVGLAWCSFKDAGMDLTDYRLYGREPCRGELERSMAVALGAPVAVGPVNLRQLQAGDVVAVRFKLLPHHVAILGDYRYGGLSVIHSYGEVGKVVEHRLADDMIKRITHVFRIKD